MIIIILFFFIILFNNFNIFILILILTIFLYINKNIFLYNIFLLDNLSLGILFILTLIRLVILEYNKIYFFNEISKKKFNFFLILFIFVIVIFTTCINFILLYIFWEFIRIISFILINWWKERKKSLSSSFSTIFYNRIGDFFFFFTIRTINNIGFFIFENKFIYRILIFSVISKSAMFLFHSWLPLAIERPTPVSSLLHSSTIVVARVYMYLRLIKIIDLNFNNIIIFISSITFFWRRFASFNQTDIKKIIAYSTISQIRFIIITSSIMNVNIAFFVLICHGLFKSILFICSGIFIHSSGNIQFKIFNFFSQITNSITYYIYFISILALIGFPFFTRFIYKHLILDNILSFTINLICVFFFIIRSVFTVIYSLNLLFSNLLKRLKINFIYPTEKINSFYFIGFVLLIIGFIGRCVLKYLDKDIFFYEIKFNQFNNIVIFFFIILIRFFIFLFKNYYNNSTRLNTFYFNFFFINFIIKKNIFLINYILIIENFFFEKIIFYIYYYIKFNLIKINFKIIILTIVLIILLFIIFRKLLFEVFHF